MSIISERGINKAGRLNDELEPPKGWFIAEEELERNYITSNHARPEETERFIKANLPLAAKRAERLIDALGKKLNIEVPESYLRVRDDGAFHVLLLVSQADFVSPKIAAARILAEEFARTEAYDICFTFSVQSESVNVVVRSDYKLKHIKEHFDNQSRLAS
jgi:hypothetical protein